jgi:hypothetical protein
VALAELAGLRAAGAGCHVEIIHVSLCPDVKVCVAPLVAAVNRYREWVAKTDFKPAKDFIEDAMWH